MNDDAEFEVRCKKHIEAIEAEVRCLAAAEFDDEWLEDFVADHIANFFKQATADLITTETIERARRR